MQLIQKRCRILAKVAPLPPILPLAGKRASFRQINLLQFAVNSVATEIWIVFLFLEALRVSLAVLSCRVARWRQALFASFCAFKSDDFNFAFFSHNGPFLIGERIGIT